jgi:hypothetical protein
MTGKNPGGDPGWHEPMQPAAPSSGNVVRSRRWPLLVAVVLLVGVGITFALRRGSPGQPAAAGPLDGKLIVYVRPPGRSIEPLPIEDKGATPVRDGGIMSLEVQTNQPAFSYFVWLDCEGQALPLYPWNSQYLEVKDLSQPAPERRASNHVYSPLLGGGWTFGEASGPETVLLLVRRTPLGKDVNLADLISSLPRDDSQKPNEVLAFSLIGNTDPVSTLLSAGGPAQPHPLAADDPLAQLVQRLSKHFELIRAVRFIHE